jgi:hypothetical protein
MICQPFVVGWTRRWRRQRDGGKRRAKIHAIYFVFQSQATPTTKAKKGNCQGMLKVIQHALTIANFLSDHPARLGIAIKMASIREGNYHVVKKRALCCSRSVCFFVLPRDSKN